LNLFKRYDQQENEEYIRLQQYNYYRALVIFSVQHTRLDETFANNKKYFLFISLRLFLVGIFYRKIGSTTNDKV
jgi:hypothetical protein